MVDTYVIVSAVIAVIAIVLGVAYETGALDPVIEQIGIMMLKTKAKAEEKKMQAQGLKEGQDFLAGELKGNQQADELKDGIGGIAGLKKGL